MIDYNTLISEYWGDGHPLNWKSLQQIADEKQVTIGYVEDLMSRYSVEYRLKPMEARKVIFEVLVKEWCLVEGKDFLYKHKEGMVFCLFWLVKDNIGINLNPALSWNESDSIFIGDAEVVYFPTEDFDTLRNAVNNFLEKYNVAKNIVEEKSNDGGW